MLLGVLIAIAHAALLQGDFEAQEHAIILHAQALDQEFTGDGAAALSLMRRARAMDPEDENIAFDLARLALQHKSPTLMQDAAGFLRMQPSTADGQILRAYLLSINVNKDAVNAALAAALRLNPNHPEALLARTMLDGASATPQESALSGQLSMSTGVDTNVSLLPQDQASHLKGWRTDAGGSLRWTPLRGTWRIDLAASARGGMYPVQRTDLKLYDTASGATWGSFQYNGGALMVVLDTVGVVVFAGEQKQYFMRDGYAQLEVRAPLDKLSIGLYGAGGVRQFGYGNQTGKPLDRSGPHADAGLLLEGAYESWTFVIRAGGLQERTAGIEQQVQGGKTTLMVRWDHDAWAAAVALGYELRNYNRSTLQRRDDRLQPSMRLAYALTDHVRVSASYLFMNNVSTLSAFAYRRHLAEFGTELTW